MLALLLVACALPSCSAAEDDSDEGDGYGAGAQPGAQPPAPPSGVKTLTGARIRPHLPARVLSNGAALADDNFEAETSSLTHPLIVEFYGPCTTLLLAVAPPPMTDASPALGSALVRPLQAARAEVRQGGQLDPAAGQHPRGRLPGQD